MTEEAIKKLVRATAIVSVIIGGLGSAACLPYAFSPRLSFVTTTGIYFIAGGIMIVGGLITLALSDQTVK